MRDSLRKQQIAIQHQMGTIARTHAGSGMIYVVFPSATADDVLRGSLYMNQREYFRSLSAEGLCQSEVQV